MSKPDPMPVWMRLALAVMALILVAAAVMTGWAFSKAWQEEYGAVTEPRP